MWKDSDIFGRNVTDKLSNQTRFTTPPQVTCASALPGKNGKHKNCIFHSLNSPLPEFNQSLHGLFSLFWLTTHTHCCMTPYILQSMRSARSCWVDMAQEKGSRERCSSWTVLHAQCTSALSSGFPLSQGNAEALNRWCLKTKQNLISYFLSNTSVKIIVIGSCRLCQDYSKSKVGCF